MRADHDTKPVRRIRLLDAFRDSRLVLMAVCNEVDEIA